MGRLDQTLEQALKADAALGLKRTLSTVEGYGPEIEVNGARVVDFASNDYLGLAAARHPSHPQCAGASRLVSGNRTEHASLEAALARFLEVESALLFTSGYAANVGTVAALVGKGDVVFSDRLNHASLIDGCRLSGAQVHVYEHADVGQLGALLTQHRGEGRALVLSESIFSMDGDVAPLPALHACAREHDAWLYVDEAHALGVCGPSGRGACAALDVQPDVLLGTLGKSLGAQGAFIAGSRTLRDYLIHRARSFVFSTGLSPANAFVAERNLASLAQADEARAQTYARQNRFRELVQDLKLKLVGGPGFINGIVVGSPSAALELSDHLFRCGVYARAIRPPTVPTGTSRVRIVFSTHHSDGHVDRLCEALRSYRTATMLDQAQG